MGPVTAWRLPLRIARRDALRHRGRSLLALVMIALPVLSVTTAAVLITTQSVSGPESVDRRMGAAQALVSVTDGVTSVEQPPDPDQCCPQSGDVTEGTQAATAAQVRSTLGGGRLLDVAAGQTEVATAHGSSTAEVTETDLDDPLARGLFRLTDGRLPAAQGEVVVNQALLAKGYALGDRLDLTGTDAPADPRIVGVAESTTLRDQPVAAGPIGALGVGATDTHSWLVGGRTVTWPDVRRLNAIGATVASRAVIDHPPPTSEVPPSVRSESDSGTTVTIVALVVTMALIEVVLLAGPSFAVGARRQQRSLALLAASGGTPTQARRVVLAGAVVLGGTAAVVGAVIGVGLARLVQPLLQARSSEWFGPFDVPWLALLGVAAFGMASALLAAVVPAYLASRQDVVAVLAGRRGDRAPSLRSPVIGLVLLGVGVLASLRGASQQAGGELFIAAGAIPAVLGMVLLVPVALAALAKASYRLPLVLRYAVRDANRHRTRTVPAVAAVAATVAGVVALSISTSSDERENRETYHRSVADGVGIVTDYQDPAQGQPGWGPLRAAVQRELPTATVTDQVGLPDNDGFSEVKAAGAGLGSSGSSLGASVMVSDDALPPGTLGVSTAEAAGAAQALRSGDMVVFYSAGTPTRGEQARLVRHTFDESTGTEGDASRATARAYFVRVDPTWAGPMAVVPTPVARQLGVVPTTVALAVTDPAISRSQQDDVNEAVRAVSPNADMYLERGYQEQDATVILQWVLIGLGAVLMLGGTLTATFLALSDARPDLATLSAVGASPRARRGIAMAYAVVVGLVGAVLGAAVGFIPGIAVSFPLTTLSGTGCVIVGSGSCVSGDVGTGPFIDVPWLHLLVLILALPLLTALVVGLFARSRLPLVARLD